MGYKGIICPVCGSNLVEEIENGRLKCASCGTVIENENTFSDTNAIVVYMARVNKKIIKDYEQST